MAAADENELAWAPFWDDTALALIQDASYARNCRLIGHSRLTGPENEYYRVGAGDEDPYRRNYISFARNHVRCNINLNSNKNNYIGLIHEICDSFLYTLKVNIHVGYILHNVLTGQVRYFYASNNTEVVRWQREIPDDLEVTLSRSELLKQAFRIRPDSTWVVADIVNLQVNCLFCPDILGGCSDLVLPDYVRKKMSILSFSPKLGCRNGMQRNDNRCFFRCLSAHLHSKSERYTDEYFMQFCTTTGLRANAFTGVSLDDLTKLEGIFKVAINVYCLNEDDSISPVRKSHLVNKYKNVMTLNVYSDSENRSHYSLIVRLKSYLKNFKCPKCGHIFVQATNFNTHKKVECTPIQRQIFPGGVFQGKKDTIFRRLDKFGIHIPDELRYLSFRLTYDFECSLAKRENTDDACGKLVFTEIHDPISVAVATNVPGFESARCFIRTTTIQVMVDDMMDYCSEVSDCQYSILLERYKYWFSEIDDAIENLARLESLYSDTPLDYIGLAANYGINHACIPDSMTRATYDDDNESDNDDDDNDNNKKKKISPLAKLRQELDDHLRCLPAIGFNSSRYDLPAIKTCLFSYLLSKNKSGNTLKHVIQNCNDYKSIDTTKLLFLDILNYLPPGYNYTSYLRAFKVSTQKGFFPYEYLDDVSRLSETCLPPHTSFFSKIRGANITSEEYKFCCEIWRSKDMSTLADYLVWYNILDVIPFLMAIEKQFTFYVSLGVDMFRDAISLPGLCQTIMYSDIGEDNFFESINLVDKDMYKTLRENIVGGPSIVFCRYAEVDVTGIRSHIYDDSYPCKKILGLDANALYLHALGQEMPCGFYKRHSISPPANHSQFNRLSFSRVSIEWLEYLMFSQSIRIQHAVNDREYCIGDSRLPCDGFCPENNTVYEFLGCFYHDHDPSVCHRPLPRVRVIDLTVEEQRGQLTIQKLKHIKALGYNLVYIWECEFTRQINSIPALREFVLNYRQNCPHRILYSETEYSSVANVCDAILDSSLFGLVECDIDTPPRLREYMSEFPPIFKNVKISKSDIGPYMTEIADERDLLKKPSRSLVSSYTGVKILLTTPILKWYLDHGLEITRVYQIFEFTPVRCFTSFVNRVSDARRSGDLDPDKAIIADTNKLLGNSLYRRTLMNRSKFSDSVYVKENSIRRHFVSPRFVNLNYLTDDLAEIKIEKKMIRQDLPLQIGLFVYQYAKLTMLKFYYDFMRRFISTRYFELLEMDTDSFYMSLAGESLTDLVSLEMLPEYKLAKLEWFPKTDEEWALYDKRTPGLFKVEWEGTCMVCLSCKCYLGEADSPDGSKQVCKGVNKKQNIYTVDDYLDVLSRKRVVNCVNTGFRLHCNKIHTYNLSKIGLSGFYYKRVVAMDGVHTTPLDI